MHAAQFPILPGSPFGEFAGYFEPVPRRLFVCVAVSAVVLAVGIATVDISLPFDFARWLPAVLEVTLTERQRAPAAEPEETVPAAETPRPAAASGEPRPEAAEPRPAETPVPGTARTAAAPAIAQPDVDWYEALESAAAEVGEQYATPDSLHPEFDELRRIARRRYSEPQTGKPPPIWENVEDDIYGRTLLRMGDHCYHILDDRNVGNRYAFETFEKNMLFCASAIGKRKPRNLPWVEIIRARYQHLRDPDGSQSAARAPPSAVADKPITAKQSTQ